MLDDLAHLTALAGCPKAVEVLLKKIQFAIVSTTELFYSKTLYLPTHFDDQGSNRRIGIAHVHAPILLGHQNPLLAKL